MSATPTVFVVDDDEAMRESLRWLIESIGLAVETWPSGEAFLQAYDENRPGCVVLDVRMPGLSGLAVQERLEQKGSTLPVILLSGHGDVSVAVQGLKHGAVDFLQKPFADQALLDCIQQAIQRDAKNREKKSQRLEFAKRLARLTRREKEVLERMVAGKANKVIAAELKRSEKTVEFHRAKVMSKMQVDSLAELVRLVLTHSEERGT